jgi:hypothetical protein
MNGKPSSTASCIKPGIDYIPHITDKAVINGGCVKVEDGDDLHIASMKDKDIEKFKNVIVYYKNTKSLEVSMVDFLKKCYKRGLTKAVYSPSDPIEVSCHRYHTC